MLQTYIALKINVSDAHGYNKVNSNTYRRLGELPLLVSLEISPLSAILFQSQRLSLQFGVGGIFVVS